MRQLTSWKVNKWAPGAVARHMSWAPAKDTGLSALRAVTQDPACSSPALSAQIVQEESGQGLGPRNSRSHMYPWVVVGSAEVNKPTPAAGLRAPSPASMLQRAREATPSKQQHRHPMRGVGCEASDASQQG